LQERRMHLGAKASMPNDTIGVSWLLVSVGSMG